MSGDTLFSNQPGDELMTFNKHHGHWLASQGSNSQWHSMMLLQLQGQIMMKVSVSNVQIPVVLVFVAIQQVHMA